MLSRIFSPVNGLIFRFLSSLVFGRFARDLVEYAGPTEDSCEATIGPFSIGLTESFVVDYKDVCIWWPVPLTGGRMTLGCRFCCGEDRLRQGGFFIDDFR